LVSYAENNLFLVAKYTICLGQISMIQHGSGAKFLNIVLQVPQVRLEK
jgi:hypothetical protein